MEPGQLPDEAPAPRLCHLIKWPDFDGYGFNLHADRSNPGQFVGKIDEQSPAQLAGLHEGDRIVEVNGINICNENHRQVVERIKSLANEAKLLVVDAPADEWYCQHDLVVKSSQMNVIYKRTPVPRPTSNDFDAEDEQQVVYTETNRRQSAGDAAPAGHKQAPTSTPSPTTTTTISDQEQQQSIKTSADSGNAGRAPPVPTSDSVAAAPSPSPQSGPPPPAAPMSPDSGAGDDDAEPAPAPAPANGTLTIEAEINRQSPRASGDQQPLEISDSDSLEPLGADAKDRARLVHNGSADSGKSSSPDAGSNNDSLEDQHNHRPVSPSRDEELNDNKQEQVYNKDQPITETSNINPATPDYSEKKLGVNVKKSPETTTTTTPIATSVIRNAPEEGGTGRQIIPDSNTSNKAQAPSTPSPMSQAQATVTVNNNNANCEPTKQLESPTNNNNNSYSDSDSKTTTPMIMTTPTSENHHQQAPATKQVGGAKAQASATLNNNNNSSGLNLNMTASEMRELLARRKKFDPKKAQMNIRQKYEIIQQM